MIDTPKRAILINVTVACCVYFFLCHSLSLLLFNPIHPSLPSPFKPRFHGEDLTDSIDSLLLSKHKLRRGEIIEGDKTAGIPVSLMCITHPCNKCQFLTKMIAGQNVFLYQKNTNILVGSIGPNPFHEKSVFSHEDSMVSFIFRFSQVLNCTDLTAFCRN